MNSIDEATYPSNFSMEEFKKIKSFAGKNRYAAERLQRISSGTSRIIYKIDDSTVLKLAKNKKGIAQNEVESEPYKQNYDIIARVFDYDSDFNFWLEMEYARRLKSIDLNRILKIDNDQFISLISSFSDYASQIVAYADWKEIRDSYPEEAKLLVEEFESFVIDYGYPLPGDFKRLNSWGVVDRDGKERLVLIDYGFDNSVRDIYFPERKKWNP